MSNYRNIKIIENIKVHYKTSQVETFEIISDTIHKASRLVKDRWNLIIPNNSRIYVMENWIEFLFQSAPVYYWPLICLNIPFIFPAMNKNWRLIGGWTKKYGKRCVVGVKDKELINLDGSELGKKIFISENTIEEKMIHIITHELTHLCLANHNKPEWFNEGIAMVAVDRILNKNTVKKDTLKLLTNYSKESFNKNLLSNYVVGYWFIKYLDEKQPENLRRIVSKQNISEDESIKEILISFDSFRDKVIKYFDI